MDTDPRYYTLTYELHETVNRHLAEDDSEDQVAKILVPVLSVLLTLIVSSENPDHLLGSLIKDLELMKEKGMDNVVESLDGGK